MSTNRFGEIFNFTTWGESHGETIGCVVDGVPSKIELNEKKATVVREVDLGLETIEIDLPAVITTDLRLNEPRYVKLPDIMKAKNKPLEIIPFTDFKIKVKNTLKTINIEPPEKRQKGIMVNDSHELINVLKEKGLL